MPAKRNIACSGVVFTSDGIGWLISLAPEHGRSGKPQPGKAGGHRNRRKTGRRITAIALHRSVRWLTASTMPPCAEGSQSSPAHTSSSQGNPRTGVAERRDAAACINRLCRRTASRAFGKARKRSAQRDRLRFPHPLTCNYRQFAGGRMKQAGARADLHAYGLLHLQGNLQQNPPPSGRGQGKVAILFLAEAQSRGTRNFFWRAARS